MRLLPLVSLLAASPFLLAQDASKTSAVVFQAPVNQNCPVGLDASHAQQGGLINVAPPTRNAQQAYRLTFAPDMAHSLAQVKVTLHGLSGPQVIPAGKSADGAASESFNLVPASGPNHRFHSTVYASKLTAVQWVELNEVTYADGTKWMESKAASCRVAPNGFMLVAQH